MIAYAVALYATKRNNTGGLDTNLQAGYLVAEGDREAYDTALKYCKECYPDAHEHQASIVPMVGMCPRNEKCYSIQVVEATDS
jgi:hypothetical protein